MGNSKEDSLTAPHIENALIWIKRAQDRLERAYETNNDVWKYLNEARIELGDQNVKS